MPLKAYRRESGIYHIRGTHHGVRVDRSANTRVRADAQKVAERLEREIFNEVVLKKPRERTFAEAATMYMRAGGERAPLQPILRQVVEVDGGRSVFGELALGDIDQSVVDALALAIYPDAQGSTRNRKIYTPVAAVLNAAASQPKWNYRGFRLRRPPEPKGRLDWRTPEEIEWWLERAGHAAPLLTTYVGSGARATELIELEWPGVSMGCERITLADTETKAQRERSIDLQPRVRAVFPARPPSGRGRVFLNAAGAPWHAYDAINGHLERIAVAETFRRASPTELAELKALEVAARTPRRLQGEERDAFTRRRNETSEARAAAGAAFRREVAKVAAAHDVRFLHLHVLRHTWATWAYAVTGDLTFVMGQGGWASEKLALRYIHGATPSLRRAVLDYGWEMREDGSNSAPQRNVR